MKPPVVFDFDGVVADSTNECMVTAWNAWQAWRGRQDKKKNLDEFSPELKEQFRLMRPYVKGAGEFYIIMRYLEDSGNRPGRTFNGQKDYEIFYRQWEEHLQPFKAVFYEQRELLRKEDLRKWIGLHHVFPEVIERLKALSAEKRLYIATMKDSESVELCLEYQGLNHEKERIFDQARIKSKLEALDIIADREKAAPGDLVFIDDNVNHLFSPVEAGYRCYLATWGSALPEYRAIAENRGIPTVTLQTLVTVAG